MSPMIVDGTQYVQGMEQEPICVRYVNANYRVHEDFVGLYNIAETTGASLNNMTHDAMLRLNLPITCILTTAYYCLHIILLFIYYFKDCMQRL